jgi:hypothetical protein
VLSEELFSFQGFYYSSSKVPGTARKHSLVTVNYNIHSREYEDYELMKGRTYSLVDGYQTAWSFIPKDHKVLYYSYNTHIQMGLMKTSDQSNNTGTNFPHINYYL